uniref:Uncharacterized protein n=1 Tax=Palpitomonas bilix TaxID=652834 RepID=A0A7S3CY06_9EUKA|mmetsp:Transcript_14283/g.36365  ORF Transcript_14283/g.36365 Transcript_14283/m.36365 type:complete len:118 (+) Transcript_14283:370-723(+)
MSLPPPKATAQDGDAFYVEGINPMSNGICREYDDSLAWGQNYLFGGRLAPQEFGDIVGITTKKFAFCFCKRCMTDERREQGNQRQCGLHKVRASVLDVRSTFLRHYMVAPSLRRGSL